MAKQNDRLSGNSNEISLRALKEKLAIQKEINDALGYESLLHQKSSDVELQKLASTRQLNDLEKKLNIAVQHKNQYSEKTIKNIKKQIIEAKTIDKQLEKQVKNLKEQEKLYQQIGSKLQQFGSQNFGIGAMWGYLMDSDKAIKGLTLELGLSAGKTEQLRDNMTGAASYAAKMGVSMADLAKSQAAYTDETNKAVLLTTQEYKNIVNIGKGTALGVDAAGKLVGQFDLLGVSIKSSEKFVQGVVDSSERLGINATKVLKNISQNFKQLNTFSFKDGINGMAKMTQYSEKFKLDLNDSINSAKMAKSLEGAIEMASQLNVLGGEFAKTDPFELLFLSRNDPAKYTKKLADLTKGMATMVKTEDGFTFDITAQDQDRLRQAADALGVSYENLAESARKVAQVQQIKRESLGLNLTSEEKEYIEGISKFDDKSGKFYTMVNGVKKNLAQLSTSDIEVMKQQEKTLEARAKDSQTFDETFKNTVMELKSAVLPVLNLINDALGVFNNFKDWIGDTGMKWVGGLLVGGMALAKAFTIGKTVIGAGGGGIGKMIAGGAGSSGGGIGGAAAGGGSAKSIAAVGVAGAGIGVGVGAAALGVSKLATSLKDLDPKQIDALSSSLTSLGLIMGGVLLAGLVAVGIGGTTASIGLLAIGAAALGIGAGIGIAATGIGSMASGISELTQNADGTKLLGIAGGLAAIAAASTALGASGILSMVGGAGALGMILAISSQADNLMKVGDAFKSIGVVMNSNADQFERVENAILNIANAKLDSNGMFAELKELLSKPLKVEFADKSIAIKSDITLEINRERLVKVLDIGREAVVQTVRQQQGSSSARRL